MMDLHQAADVYGRCEDTLRKRAAFIWENQNTMTVGQLARKLEISSQEVTALFDLGFSLFSNGGTSNEAAARPMEGR